MNHKTFSLIAGLIFRLIGLLHVLRISFRTDPQGARQEPTFRLVHRHHD